MIGKSGERGSGISVLAARDDDDDDDDDILLEYLRRYIFVMYISRCVSILIQHEIIRGRKYNKINQ